MKWVFNGNKIKRCGNIGSILKILFLGVLMLLVLI